MPESATSKSAPKAKKATAVVRQTATKAAEATSSTARNLVDKAAAGIEANPVSVLAGGIALGALAGAFLPRSQQETKLLGSVGKRLTDTARGAVDAARDTAKSELDVLGLSRNAARDQVGKLLGDVVKALATAGTAAISAAKASAPAPIVAPKTPAARKPAAKKAKPKE